jgi:putative ATPase
MLQAHAAANALEWLGLPEARIPMAQAVLAIATAPKSNSAVKSIDRALAYVKEHPTGEVPAHLKSAGYPGAEKLGHGQGYLYPHAYPNHWVEQTYLPQSIQGETFYSPSAMGKETFPDPKATD